MCRYRLIYHGQFTLIVGLMVISGKARSSGWLGSTPRHRTLPDVVPFCSEMGRLRWLPRYLSADVSSPAVVFVPPPHDSAIQRCTVMGAEKMTSADRYRGSHLSRSISEQNGTTFGRVRCLGVEPSQPLERTR